MAKEGFGGVRSCHESFHSQPEQAQDLPLRVNKVSIPHQGRRKTYPYERWRLSLICYWRGIDGTSFDHNFAQLPGVNGFVQAQGTGNAIQSFMVFA